MRARSSRPTEVAARTLLVASALTTLVGCGEINMNKDDRPHTSPWKIIAASSAPALLPAKSSPAVVGVRARHEILGYDTWTVVLANASDMPGENRLTIDIVPEDEDPLAILSHRERPLRGPLHTPDTLAETLKREFSGAAGGPSEVGRRNRYGVYDFAIVRKGATVCALAWQMIDDKKRTLPAAIERIRLEWRFCAPGIDAAATLDPFDKMTLAPDLGILPVDDPIK